MVKYAIASDTSNPNLPGISFLVAKCSQTNNAHQELPTISKIVFMSYTLVNEMLTSWTIIKKY